MSFNRYIARAKGEGFDADQIEGDDPFYMTDAEWAAAKVNADAFARDLAAFNERKRAKLDASWTIPTHYHGNGRGSVAA